MKIPFTNFKISLFFNFVAILAICEYIFAIGKWYFSKIPGAEIFLSAAYVNYIGRWYEFIVPLGWNYSWFGGSPISAGYSSFYFLFMFPFAKFFGEVGTVKCFVIFALFIFALFSYLLFVQLSRSKGLALFLTVAMLHSAYLYTPLVRLGDVRSWIAQAFLPLVGFLIVKFLATDSRRFLAAAVLVSGLGALGFPQGFVYCVIPFSIFILLFHNPLRLQIGTRFLNLMWFLVMFGLASLPALISVAPFAKESVSKLTPGQISYTFTDDQIVIWILLVALILIWSLILVRLPNRKQYLRNVLPFGLFLVFAYIFNVFLKSESFSYKFFYSIPFAACLLAAVLFYQLKLLKVHFEFVKKLDFLQKREILLDLFLLISIFVYFSGGRTKSLVSNFEITTVSPTISDVKESPFWNANEKNRRVYSVDPAVNLSLSQSSEIPLAGGFVEPSLKSVEKWGLFWLEVVFGSSSEFGASSLIVDWKVSEQVAELQARFLLDWNAIYYLVAEHVPYSGKFLAPNVTNGVYIEKREDIGDLSYFKVKEEFVTPILSPNNASSVLHIGDISAYDTIYRFLGMKNLNSKKIIVANNSKYIDDFSLSDLVKFDAVILYRYDYHNRSKAWGLVKKYLEGGGKVYIDTGSEGYEAQTDVLPDLFPFKRTVRGDIGVNWDVSVEDKKLVENVDFNSFSPLDFDGEAWNVSHPKDDHDLSSGTHVILRNNDLVISAQKDVGSGKLIWTGFNLPYHIIRDYNEQEANFLNNLISSLVDTSEKTVSIVDYEWISPQTRKIKTGGARAVLFKEEGYGGWQARGNDGKKLQIYKAGPTSPGFMYVPFEAGKVPESVTFSYRGQLRIWILGIISTISIIFLFFKIIRGR